ncbi:CGCGG family putative rSAM-modified RiPP protein [Halosimplex salinum]|uniref:CGCGG family putative rSAM-modified RiPP protein n=1 Tax=Halosimplex salinum TaxID=1710538 RepID=UPI0019CFB343|nr:CGCGG family rSAM-modified RiPP protein [Halosimplex salinum]
MTNVSEAYADREPVTRRVHDRPWVADLETDEHAADRPLTVAEAVDAVEQTGRGEHVDLVTHERHGDPASYLYEPVRSVDRPVDIAREGRCSCGGYVTRVTVGPGN